MINIYFVQTRWGVGFGPRDCSDYSTGVSIVPISRLTDADCKWMLTAEYGGSGGKPIETGMVVEEPDIEIGAGVSSKGMTLLSDDIIVIALCQPPPPPLISLLTCSLAISRRMGTDRGGWSGPRSSRDDAFNPNNISTGNSRFRQPEHEAPPQTNNVVGAPPPIPNFGFQFPALPNGMPMFPPGMLPSGANQPAQ